MGAVPWKPRVFVLFPGGIGVGEMLSQPSVSYFPFILPEPFWLWVLMPWVCPWNFWVMQSGQGGDIVPLQLDLA